MRQVSQSILILGPLDRVFDLVTTAKYWPCWHPATVAVSGAIDAPMRSSDKIRERARIGGIESEGEWTVVSHDPPYKVVLQMPGTRLGNLEISYGFAEKDGGVEFKRHLVYDTRALPPELQQAIERQMETDTAEALRNLKVLVEEMIVA